MESGQNVRLNIGDDRRFRVTVSNPTGFDTTGMSARYEIVTGPMGRQIVTKASGGAGILIAAGPNNTSILTISLTAADTVDVDPGLYWHEATMVSPTGAVVSVMTGNVTLTASNP